jgi:hypothetical protein
MRRGSKILTRGVEASRVAKTNNLRLTFLLLQLCVLPLSVRGNDSIGASDQSSRLRRFLSEHAMLLVDSDNKLFCTRLLSDLTTGRGVTWSKPQLATNSIDHPGLKPLRTCRKNTNPLGSMSYKDLTDLGDSVFRLYRFSSKPQSSLIYGERSVPTDSSSYQQGTYAIVDPRTCTLRWAMTVILSHPSAPAQWTGTSGVFKYGGRLLVYVLQQPVFGVSYYTLEVSQPGHVGPLCNAGEKQ